MRFIIPILLVLSALLLSDADAWRIRIRGRRILRAIGRAIGIITVVGALGKRADACQDSETDEQVNDLIKEECKSLEDDFLNGLTLDEINTTFVSSDANGDGVLVDDEVEVFSDVILLYEKCADLAKSDTE